MNSEEFESFSTEMAHVWLTSPKTSREMILDEWPYLYRLLDGNSEAVSRHRQQQAQERRKMTS